MSRITKGVTALCGAIILTALMASSAAAGCVDPPTLLSQRALSPLATSAGKRSAAFEDGKRSGSGGVGEEGAVRGRLPVRFLSPRKNEAPVFLPAWRPPA